MLARRAGITGLRDRDVAVEADQHVRDRDHFPALGDVDDVKSRTHNRL